MSKSLLCLYLLSIYEALPEADDLSPAPRGFWSKLGSPSLRPSDPGKVQNGREHWRSCHWPWSSPCKPPSSPTVPRSALAKRLASGERRAQGAPAQKASHSPPSKGRLGPDIKNWWGGHSVLGHYSQAGSNLVWLVVWNMFYFPIY